MLIGACALIRTNTVLINYKRYLIFLYSVDQSNVSNNYFLYHDIFLCSILQHVIFVSYLNQLGDIKSTFAHLHVRILMILYLFPSSWILDFISKILMYPKLR